MSVFGSVFPGLTRFNGIGIVLGFPQLHIVLVDYRFVGLKLTYLYIEFVGKSVMFAFIQYRLYQ